jgi:hypothetical protein
MLSIALEGVNTAPPDIFDCRGGLEECVDR